MARVSPSPAFCPSRSLHLSPRPLKLPVTHPVCPSSTDSLLAVARIPRTALSAPNAAPEQVVPFVWAPAASVRTHPSLSTKRASPRGGGARGWLSARSTGAPPLPPAPSFRLLGARPSPARGTPRGLLRGAGGGEAGVCCECVCACCVPMLGTCALYPQCASLQTRGSLKPGVLWLVFARRPRPLTRPFLRVSSSWGESQLEPWNCPRLPWECEIGHSMSTLEDLLMSPGPRGLARGALSGCVCLEGKETQRAAQGPPRAPRLRSRVPRGPLLPPLLPLMPLSRGRARRRPRDRVTCCCL